MHTSLERSNNRRASDFIAMIPIVIMYLYPLLARRTFKMEYAPMVDGVVTSNEMYIYMFMLFMCFIVNIIYRRTHIISLNGNRMRYAIAFVIAIVYTSIITFIQSVSFQQSMYALVILYLPMIITLFPNKRISQIFNSLITFFAIFALGYSLLQIFMTINAGDYFSNLKSKSIVGENQYRSRLPIGVATTSVLFFSESIPIVFLAYKRSTRFKWILNITKYSVLLSAILTLSRAGVAVALFMFIWCIHKEKNMSRKLFVAFACICLLILISSYFDISRLFIGFSDSSSSDRFNSLRLGLTIFLNNVLTGTGVGRYFVRAYEATSYTQKLIIVYSTTGMVDTHNAYALLMSELGLVGIGIWAYMIYYLRKQIVTIRDKDIRSTGIQLLTTIALYSFASSNVVNTFGIAGITWIFVWVFLSMSASRN